MFREKLPEDLLRQIKYPPLSLMGEGTSSPLRHHRTQSLKLSEKEEKEESLRNLESSDFSYKKT